MVVDSNDSIFGIRIYNFENNIINILFEKIYDKIMNDEEKKEVYLFYNELNEKNEIYFDYYTERKSTYEEKEVTYKTWYPISLKNFLENFNNEILYFSEYYSSL